MNLNPIMGALLKSADAPSQASGDYINPADGLKYCVKCRTPKEAFFPENLRRNGMDKHPVLCKCAAKARAEKESEEKKEQHRKKVTMLQTEAFRDIPAALWRFDAVPVMTAQLSKAKQYVENWDSFKRDEIGLLLFGDVGTGKTYAADCIANALIDKEVSVLMVGVSDVVNRMQGNFGADRDSYMASLMRPELLILDDLGAERNTSFGKERVFDVINRRRLTGKPMIITTNIAIVTMQKAASLDERRIYDRILEVCVPIRFDGENFRRGNAKHNLEKAAQLLRDQTILAKENNMEDKISTVPIHLKMTLTAREAAEYSNIGINKIDSMLRTPNCPFVLFVGTKKLVKRREFEQYISRTMAI